jgi:hypothetical protein
LAIKKLKKADPMNEMVVGRFGERLAQRVLGGELFGHTDKRGDLFCPTLNAFIEVRMSSTRQPPQLRDAQIIHQHEGLWREEYGHFYLIIRYTGNGTKNGKRISLLKLVKGPQRKKVKFLASRVREMFLVDTSVLYEAISVIEARNKRATCQGRVIDKVLRFPKKHLDRLAAGEPEVFSLFGLSRDDFTLDSLPVSVKVDGFKIKVEMFRIIRKRVNINTSFDVDTFESESSPPQT